MQHRNVSAECNQSHTRFTPSLRTPVPEDCTGGLPATILKFNINVFLQIIRVYPTFFVRFGLCKLKNQNDDQLKINETLIH